MFVREIVVISLNYDAKLIHFSMYNRINNKNIKNYNVCMKLNILL